MSVIKAIFFDLDGTLVDTHDANFFAYSEAIGSVLGVEPGEALRGHIRSGLSSNQFIPLVLPGVDELDVQRVNEEKKKIYPNHLHRTQLNTGLIDFIEHFSQEIRIGLVTTAKRVNAMAVLNEHGIEDRFDFFIFGDDVEHMKPHPEAYERALSIAGVAPNEAIAFEDSDKGADSAAAAGISVMRVEDFSL